MRASFLIPGMVQVRKIKERVERQRRKGSDPEMERAERRQDEVRRRVAQIEVEAQRL